MIDALFFSLLLSLSGFDVVIHETIEKDGGIDETKFFFSVYFLPLRLICFSFREKENYNSLRNKYQT